MSFDWSVEDVALLKEMWAEGFSALAIAKTFGDDLSRNAVIGKLHRLGLNGHTGGSKIAEHLRKPHVAKPPVVIVAPLAVVVDQKDVSRLLPKEGGCKWPIGVPADPDFRYCNEPREENKPYCKLHMGASRVKTRRPEDARPFGNNYRLGT